MRRLLHAAAGGVRRLVTGRRRDRQYDYPEAHRQEPDRYQRIAHLDRPPAGGVGGTVGQVTAFLG
ncbi:hypothetical protein ACIRBX_37265 [Kitasatospora sp. NPDC096147]|uniref:hypothetical protein n=1 Tax=Kitasatospora sp. NPDC096147 TaxID=3364093 RepID=UPI003815F064